jgi:hypothetical protein
MNKLSLALVSGAALAVVGMGAGTAMASTGQGQQYTQTQGNYQHDPQQGCGIEPGGPLQPVVTTSYQDDVKCDPCTTGRGTLRPLNQVSDQRFGSTCGTVVTPPDPCRTGGSKHSDPLWSRDGRRDPRGECQPCKPRAVTRPCKPKPDPTVPVVVKTVPCKPKPPVTKPCKPKLITPVVKVTPKPCEHKSAKPCSTHKTRHHRKNSKPLTLTSNIPVSHGNA